MRTFILSCFLLFFLTAANVGEGYRYVPIEAFGKGERLDYRVHYGFVTGGEASMTVDKNLHDVNGRQCYKIEVHGYTTGLVDKLFNVKDTWGTYFDTAAAIPQKSYRYIREGRYRKNEEVIFDQLDGQAKLIEYEKKGKKIKKTEQFTVPVYVQDMVSGYYFLRTMDYSKLKPGEVIDVDGFFDGELYKFRVRFIGRERLKTKIGEFNALVLSPIMPENDIFDGEDAVRLYLSNDQYKIPLKIRADMFVGAVEIDIKERHLAND